MCGPPQICYVFVCQKIESILKLLPQKKTKRDQTTAEFDVILASRKS